MFSEASLFQLGGHFDGVGAALGFYLGEPRLAPRRGFNLQGTRNLRAWLRLDGYRRSNRHACSSWGRVLEK